MKKEKINIEEQAELLLNEFKEIYEPKNKSIEKLIFTEQNELWNGQIPQVVLKRVVSGIYWIVFTEKVTVGDKAGEILKKMNKLSMSKGYPLLGTLFNIRF